MSSIGTMAAGIAHEINNPLNVAMGDVSLLERDFKSIISLLKLYEEAEIPNKDKAVIEKFAKEYDTPYSIKKFTNKLTRCKTAMNRVASIVKDMRDFSHLDKGELVEIDVKKSIESSIQFIPQKYKDDVDITINATKDVTISCFGRQLNQIFMNIIINAFQAMDHKGTLNIKISERNSYAIIEIKDSGPGIPIDKINKIFDPFYTTKAVGKGTGLGLSVSYSIIQEHGGNIEVSNNPDKGVTFKVTVPKIYIG